MLALFGGLPVELLVPEKREQAYVQALLPEADLVLADWSPSLRVDDPGERVCFVQQPSVGFDGVDTDACAARGVPVANTAGANSISVAEWAVSAVLALLRRTVVADRAVREGHWPQTSLGGSELAGKRVGIVGMGPIGQACARLFEAFGCPVSYWSRTQKDVPFSYEELPALLAGSDVVVVVVALGPDTRGIVDPGALKPGALLVNGARGEVVVESAIPGATHLGGVALDVFSIEPLPANNPLRDGENILLSPHMAGSTAQAAMRIVGKSTANLRRVLAGEPVVDVVNGVDPAVARR